MVPLGREMIPRPRRKLNRAASEMKNPILVLEIEENTETFLNSPGTNISKRHYQFEQAKDVN
jgi:hypothetical protein